MSYKDKAVSSGDAVDHSNLMCAARGCPNRWSISMGNGNLCRWHNESDPIRWPAITQEQLDAMADRAFRNGGDKAPEPRMSRSEALARLKGLRVRDTLTRPMNRDWAHRIVERYNRGEKVALATLAMAREAIGTPAGEYVEDLREAA